MDCLAPLNFSHDFSSISCYWDPHVSFSFSSWLSHSALSAFPASRHLLRWDLVPRWRPGEERWFSLQALLHVRWTAQDPTQRRGGCQNLCRHLSDVRPVSMHCWLSLSLTSPYLLYVWGSQYCRAINQNWMHPARSRVDRHDGTLFSFSFQRKRHRGLEKDLCLLPVSRQLRCLPFFLPPFVLFFLLFVCILRWPQPYWERICQIKQTQGLQHVQKPPMNYGGLTGAQSCRTLVF